MLSDKPVADCLVLYKSRPARVFSVTDKLEIELPDGKSKRVRPKDVTVLHPGPVRSLADLAPGAGEVEEAWQLLAGGSTDLEELSELIYGEFSPATSWATWQLVAEGLYFQGTPDAIEARLAEEVAADRAQREAKIRAEREWAELLARLESGDLAQEDREKLSEVEELALGQREGSRILLALGHQTTVENAHRFLTGVGYWDPYFNPYPLRVGINLAAPQLSLPELPEEPRRDLTGLPAFAIDDEGSEDPDDAISLDGDRIWVHIADAAALAPPGSEPDLEARSRGANLYLPEGLVPMLPAEATPRMGLGLNPVSAALSVGFRFRGGEGLTDIEVVLSWVKVTRLSYAEVDELLPEEPFRSIRGITDEYRASREAAGAVFIDLPEASVRVREGRVLVRPLSRTGSREMVTDAMVMGGEAVASYASERGIPIPYAVQPPPDSARASEDLAGQYAFRRQLKPSRLSIVPEPHSGLGLGRYARATSPLRRYSDLLVHQQLRAHLQGRPLLEAEEVAQRIAVAELGATGTRKAERLSNLHWKLVYLKQNPQWRGEAVVVELADGRGTLVIPDLAMEARLRLRHPVALNDRRLLAVQEIDLPDLLPRFQVRERRSR